MRVRAAIQMLGSGRGLLRLAPFETGTSEGRRLERYRRVALSAAAAGVARLASITTALVVVPVAVRYLGSERYGLFATITSLTALVGFADLGLGNGLVSEIADANGRDDRRAAARATSTAFFFLAALALVLAAVFAAAYHFVPWPSIFNIGGRGASEAGAATAAFAAGVFLALPLSTVQRAEIGYQETFVASLWQAVGSVLALAGVLFAIAAGASLPWIVLSVAMGPIVALTGNGFVFFRRRRPWLRPSLRLVQRSAGIALLRVGALFFVLQVAMAVAYESDALVLTQILGPGAVTLYSVTMRVFLIFPSVAAFALAPLWPAYGEAISRGDAVWVETTFRRSVRLSLTVSIPAAAVLLVAARPAIHLWAGVRVPYSLIVAAAVWIVPLSLTNAIAMFLNGARVIRAQMVLASLMMVSNLGISIALTSAIGLSGVVWGSAIAQTVFIVAPASILVPRTFRRIRAVPTPAT